MSKTKEELEQLKQEYESLNTKFKELSEEELNEIAGGGMYPWCNSYKAYQARTYHVCPTYNTCPMSGLCKATKQDEVKE